MVRLFRGIAMKIAFINVGTLHIDDDHLEPNLGALYIASNLQKNGYNDIQFYDVMGCKSEYEMEVKIRNIPQANYYSFTVYCTNYNYVKMCINHIKKTQSKAIIICGGPNASALPEFTLNDSKCDFVVVGEGEDAVLEIIRSVERKEYIPNIVHGVARENLDTLSFPAWDLVDLNNYSRVLDGERVISILSSRGCVNACTHCNSTIMGAGRKIRYRSIQNIIEEIKYLKSLGYQSYRLNDDNFACRPDLKELTLELKKLNIKYRIFAHIKDMTDENCYLLSKSGCIHISIGIESMNPDNLRFLRKNTNVDLIEQHLRNIRRHGMMSRVYFIVGLIHDTDETIKKYFTIASLLNFSEYNLYPLIPYPGTAIWNTPEKYGYEIIDKNFQNYYQIGINKNTCYALRHKNFNEHDIKKWRDWIMYIFNKNNIIHTSKSDTK